MLADVLPGFREVRAPLVAGYLWLLFAWFLVGHHVEESGGAVGRLFELGGAISDVALAAAASFVAYLIGSLSEDVFVRALNSFVQSQALEGRFRFGRFRHLPRGRYSDLPEALIQKQMDRLENEQGRLRAERNLRISVVPPLAAILVYFGVVDSWLWWFAFLLVVPALMIQAYLRAQEFFVISDGLYELRKRLGLPPESVREASSRTESAPPGGTGGNWTAPPRPETDDAPPPSP